MKMIDDDICNRKIEFKAKIEIMKRNKNYKEDMEKLWSLKCKEIAALRNCLYKF